MKFIVSSSLLYKELQNLGGIINSTNTIPILDNFLFNIEKNKLKITSSDLESSMTSEIEIESESSDSIAISAKLLLDTLKTFADQPLTFSKSDKNTIEISADNGKYSLAYLDGSEFPKEIVIQDASATEINAEDFLNAINSTIFASGNDDLRPVMSGVFFQLTSENLTFVATDAHKLVKYKRNDIKASTLAEFIMPKKPLNLLKNIIDNDHEITIEYNNSNAKFEMDGLTVICRLIDGQYPNYEAVIPNENPNVLTIDRSLLLSSLKRVSIFSNKTTHQVRLKIAGAELNISAEDVDFSNKAEERLTCDYKGEDIEIGFNSRFLIEMTNNLDCKEVKLEMSLPNRAGILRPLDGYSEDEELTMLVMPVMLNN